MLAVMGRGVAVALWLGAFGCGGVATPAPRVVDSPTETEPEALSPSLALHPPSGDSHVVEVGPPLRMVRGGLRVEVEGAESRLADQQHWAPLIGASRVDGGWVFVDADGVVTRSESFTGPLERLGELPRKPVRGSPFQNAPGGLCVADRHGWLHLIRGEGLEPAIRPVAGELALGCHVVTGEGALVDRALTWVDGGRLFRLGESPTELLPPPNALLADGAPDGLRFGDLAYGSTGPVQTVAAVPEAPNLWRTFRDGEPLRGFEGKSLGPDVLLGDGLLDLRSGDWTRLSSEACERAAFTDDAWILDCGDERYVSTDGLTLTPWPWSAEALPAGPDHAVECEERTWVSYVIEPDLAECRLLDRAGDDVTPVGWAGAPGTIVRARGRQALSLEVVERVMVRREPSGSTVPLGQAFAPTPSSDHLEVLAYPLELGAAHWFDGTQWRPVPFEGEAPTGLRSVRLTDEGRIVGTTHPPGIAAGTEAGLRWGPAPEGARSAHSFDGRLGMASGHGRVWWTRDGGQRWEELPIPLDADLEHVSGRVLGSPRCAEVGCALGPLTVLWHADAGRLSPRTRPERILGRREPFAVESQPEPTGRGLVGVSCPDPGGASRDSERGCSTDRFGATSVRWCQSGRELEVRVGRGRSREVLLPTAAPPPGFYLWYAAPGWAVLTGEDWVVVVGPRGAGATNRVHRIGAVGLVGGELRVQAGLRLLRFAPDGMQVGDLVRASDAPWVMGLGEGGELVVGARDGTLRAIDVDGSESSRHPIALPQMVTPCAPDVAPTLRFSVQNLGEPPTLRFVGPQGETEAFAWMHLAVVGEGVCFESLEDRRGTVRLGPDGATIGGNACEVRWSDEGP